MSCRKGFLDYYVMCEQIPWYGACSSCDKTLQNANIDRDIDKETPWRPCLAVCRSQDSNYWHEPALLAATYWTCKKDYDPYLPTFYIYNGSKLSKQNWKWLITNHITLWLQCQRKRLKTYIISLKTWTWSLNGTHLISLFLF